jgi:hypothetical protein
LGQQHGTTDAFDTLESVKTSFPAVSYADLIVLAGQTAVEAAGGTAMQFCAGRTDAFDAAGSAKLEPRYYVPAVISIRDNMQVKGLKPQEGVALCARPSADGTLSNKYFEDLKATVNLTRKRRPCSSPSLSPLLTPLSPTMKRFW